CDRGVVPRRTLHLGSGLLLFAHVWSRSSLQGKGRNGGTGIFGILFGIARITYHSLLPVGAWHAVLDVVAGIAGARFFVPALADSGPGAEGDGRHPNENGS